MGGRRMKRTYTVSKTQDGDWYAHKVGYPGIPVFGSFGTKHHALTVAAQKMCLPLKEYMALKMA